MTPTAQHQTPSSVGLRHVGLIAAITIATAVPPHAQAPAASKTRSHVTTLASDRFEGRLVGSNGERLASDYLVSQLRRIGARPAPGASDFLLPFEFTAGTPDGGSAAGNKNTPPRANQPIPAPRDRQA